MHKTKSRLKNAARNVTVSLIAQVIILAVSFLNRTVFIKLLGAEYLGIDGLFTSILTVFSLAELGIGNAIIFNLYKPISQNDTHKSRQFITLYEKAYNAIIISIICVGIILMPFLRKITKADLLEIDINIYIVFVLFLFNTVSSYFLAHRQAVLVVNQRQSSVSLWQLVIKISALICECAVLYIFRNYYIFLSVKVIANYIQAIIISMQAKKEFPELCEKSNEKLSKEEICVVKKNVGALFIRRIGSVVLSSADNIIINGFVSTVMVGVYSNYTMIIMALKQLTVQIFTAMTATVGNFVAAKCKDEVETLFKVYTFAVFIVYGITSVCFYVLVNRFILLLWGKAYILSKAVVFTITLDYFMYGFQNAINTFRDTTGNFVQGKYRAIFSAIVNAVLSVILVKPLGIGGVILATVISRVAVSAWYDPYVLYKYFFKKRIFGYYMRLLGYILVMVIMCLGIDFLLSGISCKITGFIICVPICAILSCLVIIPYIKTSEFMHLCRYGRNILSKVLNKINKKTEEF